jgi:hypothetical protein
MSALGKKWFPLNQMSRCKFNLKKLNRQIVGSKITLIVVAAGLEDLTDLTGRGVTTKIKIMSATEDKEDSEEIEVVENIITTEIGRVHLLLMDADKEENLMKDMQEEVAKEAIIIKSGRTMATKTRMIKYRNNGGWSTKMRNQKKRMNKR